MDKQTPKTRRIARGKGFTIVELMIATTVFSVVLLVVTAGLLQIGHIYYKGITSTQTQTVARSIMDSMQQDLQFSGGVVKKTGDLAGGGGYAGLCIGNRLYQFKPGVELNSSSGSVSTSGTLSSTDCGGVTSVPYGGTLTDKTEMLGRNMRITNLSVTALATPGMYTIRVTVAAGDDDLLCSATSVGANNTCNSGSNMSADEKTTHLSDVKCKNIRSGTQFCAVSDISATVQRRVKTL